MTKCKKEKNNNNNNNNKSNQIKRWGRSPTVNCFRLLLGNSTVSMSPPSGMWILHLSIFPKFFLHFVVLFIHLLILFFFIIYLFIYLFATSGYQHPSWHVFLRGNASVHWKGSLKFWVTQSSFRADANFNGEEEEEEDQRLHFFAFNPKKVMRQ